MPRPNQEHEAALFPVADLVVPRGSRRELGDVAQLAESIEVLGLINPIAVDKTGRVMAGRRRMAAVKSLGWIDVPVRVLDADEVLVEDAENAMRLPLTPSEEVHMAKRMRQRLGEQAGARRVQGQRKGSATLAGEGEGKKKPLRAADVAAKRLGTSRRTLERAEAVVSAAEANPSEFGDLVKRMDRTGKVGSAYVTLVKRKQAAALEDRAEAGQLPKGIYDAIVVDPPWRYDDNPSDRGLRGEAAYATMTVDEIAALDLPMADDCAVWLWITNSMLIEGAQVPILKAWGLTPKALLTWDKVQIGVGHYLRNVTEHCILAVRGKPTVLNDESESTILRERRGAHSEKPEAFYGIVGRLCAGQRLDIFARRKRAGWDSHGLEVDA